MLNPPGGTSPSALFHVDFGLSGSGATQVSTVSSLFGTLTYDDATKSAATSGALVGSTYGPGRGADGSSVSGGVPNPTGLTAITAPLVATAAGGGNTNLASGGETRAGYIVFQTCDVPMTTCGGIEHPVNSNTAVSGSGDVNFASLRLASGATTSAVGIRSDNDLKGYMAGLQEAAAGGISFLSPLSAGNQADPNLAIATATTGNTVAVDVAGLASGTPLHLGSSTDAASNGASAYIDEDRFGAASADGKSSLISGKSVVAATDAQSAWKSSSDGVASGGMTPDLQQAVTSYKYLQWGFFFGDVSASRAGDAYAHLSSWVAGKITASAAPTPQGVATYSGHVFGNVSTGTNMYAATGTLTNVWNFDVRQGDVTLKFDQAQYSGKTNFVGDQYDASLARFQNPGGTNNNANFIGTIASTAANRQGVLNGSFVNDPHSSATFVGEIGRFDIVGKDGGGAVNYIASGTFGAEKKP